ncbi:MAG: helix-hairpin-helix domain-containing protein, partial [Gammaproteobacteria bacterium]|nr:helix-hairpin-helix domain-containing protein [Gammaproteobacteria bacterium]
MQQNLDINRQVALLLREIADLLELQNANIYRVSAYRAAANTVSQLDVSVKEIVEQKGFDGLVELPHIGEGIARSIYEYVATEKMTRLEGLKGGSDPEALLRTVPGIGPKLAEQIHHTLHIETLEALEQMVHNGKLAELPGVGPRKIAALDASLEKMLGRPKQKPFVRGHEPSIEILLTFDEEYRQAVKEDSLPKITPKRFNP